MVMVLLMVVPDIEVTGSGREITPPNEFIATQVILAAPSSDSTVQLMSTELPSNTPVLSEPIKFIGGSTAIEAQHVRMNYVN